VTALISWWRLFKSDLRALSWRLPFVRRPQQIGAFVRYWTGDWNPYELSMSVRDRLDRWARLGGVELYEFEEIIHEPNQDSLDLLSNLGSVGWKAKVS